MLIGISGYIGSGKDTLGRMIQYQIYLEYFKKNAKPFDLEDAISWKSFSAFPDSMFSLRYFTNGVIIQKFGEPLKEIVCILTGCTLSQLEDQEFKKRELPAIWNRSVKEAREWLMLQEFQESVLVSDETVIQIANNRNFKWTRTYREMMQEIGTEVMRNHFVDDIWINALMGKYIRNYSVYGFGDKVKDIYPDWIITDVRFPNEAKAIKEAGGLLIRIDGLPRVSDHPSEISLDNYQEFDVHVQNLMNSKTLTKEESLEDLMAQATYLVKHFKLLVYAGTNIKPDPKPGSERTS